MADIDYDVDALKRNIEAAKKNIEIFENAIKKEEDTIRQYRGYIRILEEKKTVKKGVTIDAKENTVKNG